MDWSDERWVKLFTRDTTDWLALSWQAQGLFCLILRKVNRAGVIDLGKLGKRGLSSHVGGASAWRDIEPALEELLADGCVALDGHTLSVPNFVKAQTALQSDKARKRAERERDRDLPQGDPADGSVTPRDVESRNVTECRNRVTRGHAASRAVTTRGEETRGEEIQSPPTGGLPPQAPGGAPAAPSSPKAVKHKASQADDPPPQPGTPAANVVVAVAAAAHLRGITRRPHTLARNAATSFPSIDVAAEVTRANGWCESNPTRAPRSDGDAFLWRWLQRAHNDAANRAARDDQRALPFARPGARRVGPAPVPTAEEFARATEGPDPLFEATRG